MPYVDGFVLVVPKTNVQAYRRMAQKAGKVWRTHAALEVRECAGDDLNLKTGGSFTKAMPMDPKPMVYGGFKTLVDL